MTRRYNYISGVNRLLNIDNNQSTPTNHASYQHDAAGNQVQVNSKRFYEWDVADQLKFYKNHLSASLGAEVGTSTPTVQAQYHYAGGERVNISTLLNAGKETKDFQGNTEVTIYIDGVVEHRYKKNNSNVIGAEQTIVHIMDGRSRIATVRAGDDFGDTTSAIKYNLEDHLGTSTVRLDNTGGLIDREEYYPFGDSSLRTFTKKRYRYVGKEKDSESGLYYYGARCYSAWTCRFISVDPLADKYAQLTPYNYADNKPIDDLDIDGMQSPKTEEAVNNDSTDQNEKSDMSEGLVLGQDFELEESTQDELNRLAADFYTRVKSEDGTFEKYVHKKNGNISLTGKSEYLSNVLSKYSDEWQKAIITIAYNFNKTNEFLKDQKTTDPQGIVSRFFFRAMYANWDNNNSHELIAAINKVHDYKENIITEGLVNMISATFNYAAMTWNPSVRSSSFYKGRVFWVGDGAQLFANQFANKYGMITVEKMWYGKIAKK